MKEAGVPRLPRARIPGVYPSPLSSGTNSTYLATSASGIRKLCLNLISSAYPLRRGRKVMIFPFPHQLPTRAGFTCSSARLWLLQHGSRIKECSFSKGMMLAVVGVCPLPAQRTGPPPRVRPRGGWWVSCRSASCTGEACVAGEERIHVALCLRESCCPGILEAV